MPDIELNGKHHSSRGFVCLVCGGQLTLNQALPPGWGLVGGHVDYALAAAARVLGWEKDRCPKHLDNEAG